MKNVLQKSLLTIFPFLLSIPIVPLNFSSIGSILFCLGLIINKTTFTKEKFKDIFLVLFFLFFLSDTIGNLLRLDISSVFFRDIKISFLVFPIIFSIYSKTIIENYRLICYSFICGVCLYVFYSWWFVFDFYYITNPGYRLFSLSDGYIRYILYNYLPGSIHHTYIGTYIIFAIFILLHDIVFLKKRSIFKAILVLFLFTSLFFIGSKLSIALFILFIFIFLLSLKKWIINVIFTLVSLCGLFLIKRWIIGIGLNSSFYSRIEYYKCSIAIIKNNFVAGVGSTNMSKVSSLICDNEKLIPHNMYLRDSIKSKNYLYLSIVLILIMGGFVEDFIYLQRGVLFFMLFISLFYIKNKYDDTLKT